MFPVISRRRLNPMLLLLWYGHNLLFSCLFSLTPTTIRGPDNGGKDGIALINVTCRLTHALSLLLKKYPSVFLLRIGYYHELFLKGRPGLVVNLKRTKVKGTFKKKRDPGSEPKYV